MRYAIILAALLLSACDSEVGRVYYPDEKRIVSSTQSCSKGAGFCCAYGMGFNGKFEYSCGGKYNCPGSQPVILEVVPFKKIYESGEERMDEARTVIKTTGSCT